VADRYLNPNQFALPGMERISPNPMAPYLNRVQVHTKKAVGVGDSWDQENEITAHAPGSYDPRQDYGTHYSVLQWAGMEHGRSHYPGEIEWVDNQTTYEHNVYHQGKPPIRGLAQALYHTADKMAAEGQFDTRPVHSPVLTNEGARFRRKVGGPGEEDVGELQPGYHHAEKEQMANPRGWHAMKTAERNAREFHQKMGQPKLPHIGD